MAKPKPVQITVIVFWIAVGVSAGIGIAGYTHYSYLQTTALILTLVAVVWYAELTRRLLRESIRQTNLSVLPVFVPEITYVRTTPTVRGHVKLELTNIGNGAAFNIQIDSLKMDLGFEAPTLLPDPHLTFDRIVCIQKGGTAEVVYHSMAAPTTRPQDDLTTVMDWLRHLLPERAEANYTMKIRFWDIAGNKYIQNVHMGKDGCWPGVVEEDD